ncbi:sulfatase-like hydrolase/transferase [Niveispirillum sp.]|uniref:sulfatase-like hydrolase/transferase n=1 Tax=Niveispirillum sp. TaxID=1917217 RepID=UPI001B4778AC|nr:sulfatase-like hydrolase/transferase [Niveispirillum sp.]MBP7338626.1 sulfatase-like hydrolase/transferase [Niveispirillum sp.]
MKFSRRKVLAGAGVLTTAGAVGVWAATRPKTQPDLHLPPAPGSKPYNILLVTSDQEQAWSLLPPDFIERHCPGRARLQRQSLSFSRAFTPSPVCATARAMLYTGQHSQLNGVWENMPLPYAPPLKGDVPTLGTLMGAAGYHTAYFGKWHLSKLHGRGKQPLPESEVQAEIRRYGFHEVGTSHEIDGPLGGHDDDGGTTDRAVAFLERRKPGGGPWFAAVNILNPHDIMYYTSGPEMTATRRILYPDSLARPPDTPLYQEQLGYPLPANFGKSPKDGRLPAAAEYSLTDHYALGELNFEDEGAALEFVNYYYNCIRESDAHIVRLLDALDVNGHADNTIVIFTADHGEMLGVHGLRGKGVLPYREAVQVPLLVRHPQRAGAGDTPALASHIDMAPTLLGLAGVPSSVVATQAPGLVGQDLSRVILEPGAPSPRDGGGGLLMHWTSLIYQDHVAALAFEEDRQKGNSFSILSLATPRFRSSLSKRGQMRAVFDGRYKFARYFAPTDHNTPESWEALIARNDLELYDTVSDPGETSNLATRPEEVRDLILLMNAKLNRLIAREIGVDDGRHMPGPTLIWRA